MSAPLRRTLRLLGAAAAWGIAAPPSAPVAAAGAAAITIEDDLQAVLDRAREGDTVRLAEGVFPGHFRVDRSLRLVGCGAGTILDGEGSGTVLSVNAPGAVVESLLVRGSGRDLGGPDAGVFVGPRSTGAEVRNLSIEDCAFGIWVHETRAVRVTDNRVRGRSDQHPSNRGNGIHLFDSDSLVVTRNVVRQARDGIYISATDDSFFDENEVSDQRFGIHYMFSQRNTLRDNVSRNNNSAFALMQSSDLVVTGNRAEGSREHGILFRDAQRCVIRDNHLVGNAEGLFLYSSTENEIIHNHVENNDVGAKIWAGSVRNTIRDNSFVGNRCQVFYVAASDLELGVGETGNTWSDYLGWDQDGDGVGDRPYRVDSFTSNLLYRFPSAQLLLRSPSLELLAHLQERLPVLRVATVVDHSPRVGAGDP